MRNRHFSDLSRSFVLAAALLGAHSACGDSTVDGNGPERGGDDSGRGGRDSGGGRDDASGGGDSGGGGADGGGGGGSDAGTGADVSLPECSTVCFDWKEPARYVPPTPVPGPTRASADDCNPNGVEPLECPDGLVCGASEVRWLSPTYSFENPWCEGAGGPYIFEFNLEVEPPEGVAIALDFTMNGDLWPTSAPGGAGELYLTARDGSGTVRIPMPVTADGRLEAEVPEGVYDVLWVRGAAWDWARYPVPPVGAVLQVEAPGEDDVDVPSATLNWRVTVDGGAPATLTETTSSVSVTLWGDNSPPVTRPFYNGATLSGTWAVWPDTLHADILSYPAQPSSPFPTGGALDLATVRVDAEDVSPFVINLATAAVSGGFSVDGTTLDGTVGFAGPNNTRFTLPVTAGRFAGRVYPGTYSVWYQPSYREGFPQGRAPVAAAFTAPGTIDRAFTSVAVSGTVTLNGAQPLGDYRGQINFYGADGGSGSASLASFGAATYSTRLFSGAYDVYVAGDGRNLPAASARLATGWTASTTPQTYNVAGHRVDVAVTLDGRPVTGNGEYPGTIVFTEVNADGTLIADPNPATGGNATRSGSIGLPSTGNTAGYALLAPGYWRAAYYGVQDGVIPFGNVVFEDLDVRGPITRTYNLESIDVSVRLRSGSSWLPTGGAEGRGYVALGSLSLPLPASGASEVSTRVLRGDYDLNYMCDAETWCRDTGISGFVILASWLRL